MCQLLRNLLLKNARPGNVSSRMEIIQGALPEPAATDPRIRLAVDRLILAKRRWRGVAEDGAEFGFDLNGPLRDGDAFFSGAAGIYVIAQKYEAVLEVSSREVGVRSFTDAARLGWIIGNLHFQIAIAGDVVQVVDDPAVRQLFEREGIPFTSCKRVFHPLSGGHQH